LILVPGSLPERYGDDPMTIEAFKRRLTVIFSSDRLNRLKRGALKFWKSIPTALKAAASIVIALMLPGNYIRA